MSNDYVTTLLVNQKIADLRREADEDRLGRLARPKLPRHHRAPRRWWERLMLFRSRTQIAGAAASHPTVTVAGSDSPC